MLPLTTFPKRCLRGAMRCGPRRCPRLPFTKAGRRGYSTLTCILEIGIGPPREGWAYATGNAFRAATGRGISPALTPNDRRNWERDLLARYLELFSERTATRPDFDESFLHYRQQIVHALLMWTITLCHSPLLPNMQSEEAALTMIERIATAMADLDSIDSISNA